MWLLSHTRFFSFDCNRTVGNHLQCGQRVQTFVCSCMEQIELELGVQKSTVACALKALRSHVPLRVTFGGFL